MMLRTDHAKDLVPLFLAWKSFLTFLAIVCPTPGYDTSGYILLNEDAQQPTNSSVISFIDRLSLNLFRWDAIYFVKAAQRGYEYEQEWAFSWAYSQLLRVIGNFIPGYPDAPVRKYVLAGFAVSNICHLLSVLVLYRLLSLILAPYQNRKVPFIASCLHIISPASMFLIAPYAEALFSLLNFTGMLLYVLARNITSTNGMATAHRDVTLVGSGLIFAVATLIRSNGLLSGLIFLYDVVLALPDILTFRLNKQDAHRLFVTCIAGAVLPFGLILPQYLAYSEYCVDKTGDGNVRPWCKKALPSIYSWVQERYWHVGFLKYWTLPNLPLFLMAAPMLWLMIKTSVTVMASGHGHDQLKSNGKAQTKEDSPPNDSSTAICHFPQLALPQLSLALLATTNFHVQIVNRISSGYPIWYLIIATWIAQTASSSAKEQTSMKPQWAVRFMVLYGIVQGALFANFLPPA
ncbi:glycosyltransferase family 76 protein [Aaosphaeria arxii CBS 175.79]|uniref:GPI mannosyltransferase 2 n=1 Tax=Aaosphaeria arxii CBS 175.79 TaxID=1450172 RepID=A0A6A5Y6W0_9PLEO|nr:glycosyltransferase family 76 protein [Aaosphaeria arxii CBS 175.79]KAF2020540.1 glycosyltransferase family 76 protein [Aaosphaeria arxii CBS 175.79]